MLLAALAVCAFLWTTDEGFANAAWILLAAHVPVALVEGAITAFLIVWLKKAAPELLMGPGRQG